METRLVSQAIANDLWVKLCDTKGICWLPVLTDSMTPLIKPGDMVRVARVAPQKVRFGDIVVFRRGSELIVHRVLKRQHTPDGIVFSEKGDAGNVYGKINDDKVVGRVTGLKKWNQTFDLDSPYSRMANIFISAWFKIAAACVNRCKPSTNPVIRNTEVVLRKTLNLTGIFLVAGCMLVWYPAGLLSGDKTGLPGSEDA
jgi:signal peptidase I